MNKILSIVIFSGLTIALGNGLPADDKVDYTKQIKPILKAHCYSCHGALKQEGDLRLDTGTLIRKGGDSGAAIEVGKAVESLLIERVSTSNETERMPPEGEPLNQQQIALLNRWIDQGAKSPVDEAPQIDPREHWAFKVPIRPATPNVSDTQWVRNPIDAFVLARLEKEGMKPSPPADRATLLRRLSFDLLGLPPTPSEVDSFLQDDRPDAYEHLVNRLLKSTAFGQRWGRHWLDLARYADSNGYEDDRGRPDAFRFRDWVIDAHNSDMPFDRFTIEQLAGDLLPDSGYQQKVATGFHRMTLSNEGGADTVEEEFRIIAVKDRADTTGAVWLGLSVGCAKCHSHKYDPLSQQEYYQLFAFFNNAEEASIPAPPLPDRFMVEYKKKITQHKAQLAAAKQNLAEYETNVLPKKLARWMPSDAAEQNLAELVNKILSVPAPKRSIKKQLELAGYLGPIDSEYALAMGNFLLTAGNNAPLRPSTRAMTFATKTRKSHLHVRGNFLDKGDEVQPGTPQFLPPLKPRGKVADRLDLARWIVDPQNPLTARVAVNHIWRHLLGQGLVATPDQFGTTGSPPTHPKLLDWLALEFVRQGWSRKAMILMIVSTSTYRQSSRPPEGIEQLDPDNVLLSRQSRLRLEAECVRDVALAVSGLLNRQLGGPGFQPLLPTSLLNADVLKSEQLMEPSIVSQRYRRGVYINVQRMFQFPMLQVFDVADPNGSCARRDRSNTPLQALTLLNDPVFFEAAEALGQRIYSQQTGNISQKIRFAFRLCLSRLPDEYELNTLKKIMSLKSPDSELAACVVLARILINLDEFITRE